MTDLFEQHFEHQNVPTTVAEVEAILADLELIVTGDHFVYKSGEHGDAYVNKNYVTLFPELVKHIARLMAKQLRHRGTELIVSPATGGISLGQWVAHEMRVDPTLSNPLFIYADKAGEDRFVIRRNYDKLVSGKRVVVVEDIVNSGLTSRMLMTEVERLGGSVVVLSALYNRGGRTEDDFPLPNGSDCPFCPLINRQLRKFPGDDCPLCQAGKPINTDLGHGAAFVAEHGQPKAV